MTDVRRLAFEFRRSLHPTVRRLRGLELLLREKLRPPTPWKGRHAPALERFACWQGEADGVHQHDFLGVRTDPRFRPEVYVADPPGPLTTSYPELSQTYLELVFLLETVVEHRGEELTCVELGAGHGTWLVTAARAVAAVSPATRVRLVGVEMEPQRFAWMQQHFLDNGLDPDAHTLLHAAVSNHDGRAVFRAGSGTQDDYGLRLLSGSSGQLGRDAVSVRCLRLGQVLAPLHRVDLLHMDVQGEELRVLRDARAAVRRKVARVVVGTHSRWLHLRVRSLLRKDGWLPMLDFAPHGLRRTSFGDVYFVDGLLAFSNATLSP